MKNFVHRWLFVGLSTAITVFFSEKVYWYVQGYAYKELVLYYALPVCACLWAIDAFRVRRSPALVLVAALYAFLVEGVLTPVLYEAGLFDPLMPAYFIGWHGLLSFVFGWYVLQKWLRRGQWGRVLVAGCLVGLFWGAWSLTYWLPETLASSANSGRWPVIDFARYAFFFTFTLALSHWLLGRGMWPREFKPSKAEKWFIILAHAALFTLLAWLLLPWAPLKLAALLGIIFLALRKERARVPGEPHETLFSEMEGPIKGLHVLALLAMPAVATGVYALAVRVQPSEDVIRAVLLESVPFFQALVGAGLFLWAVWAVLRPGHPPEMEER